MSNGNKFSRQRGVRIKIEDNKVTICVSAAQTFAWADETFDNWTNSTLAGKRLKVEYDSIDATNILINGKHRPNYEFDKNEVDRIASQYIEQVLSEDHKCWDVCVGQFK